MGDPGQASPEELKSRRWSRGSGAVLVLLGAFLLAIGGALLWWMAPMLRHPGVNAGGNTFTGTPQQALMVQAILGAVALFGAIAFCYGLWQVRTGRHSPVVVVVLVAIAAVLYFVGLSF